MTKPPLRSPNLAPRPSLSSLILREARAQAEPDAAPAGKRPCDCTVWCGDDPWLNDGRATPCAQQQAIIDRPRVATMKRDPDNPLAITIIFDKEPSDADLSRFESLVRRQ